MALTPEEQRLVDWAKAQLPHWFSHGEREEEFLAAAAKQHGIALRLAQNWMGQTMILQAVGPTGGDADWLNMHAGERDTSRQESESNTSVRQRIRNVEDSIARPIIIAAVQAIVDGEGIVGTVYMVELRRGRAFLGSMAPDTATNGGVFADEGGGVFSFTPTTPFKRPVLGYPESTNFDLPLLTISGAPDFNNNGTFQITGLKGDGVLYANAIGVANATPTTWQILHQDILGNPRDGFAKAYLNRGYRGSDTRHTFVLILPFGCTSSTRDAVVEKLRSQKGAGVGVTVECRANP